MLEKINERKNVNNLQIEKNRIELLTANGWEQRCITDEKRLDELVDLYQSLDFEVHLEPLTQDIISAIGLECKSCYNDQQDNFKIIFTRKNELEEI